MKHTEPHREMSSDLRNKAAYQRCTYPVTVIMEIDHNGPVSDAIAIRDQQRGLIKKCINIGEFTSEVKVRVNLSLCLTKHLAMMTY
jgi:hypothetical protein